MFGSRRGRPSLIGRAAHTAARTALIAGTATAVAGRVAGRQGAASPPDAAPPDATRFASGEPVPAAGAGGLSDEAIARLQKLAELHSAGVLTAEEFAEQKTRLLA